MSTDANQLSVEESRGVPRRTIVKGAAWSLPAIATAVVIPNAAATQTCPSGTYSYVLDWGSMYTKSSLTSGVATAISTNGGPDVQVYINSVFVDEWTTPSTRDELTGAAHLDVVSNGAPVTQPPQMRPALNLAQVFMHSGGFARTDVAFSREVKNLRFSVGGISANHADNRVIVKDEIGLYPTNWQDLGSQVDYYPTWYLETPTDPSQRWKAAGTAGPFDMDMVVGNGVLDRTVVYPSLSEPLSVFFGMESAGVFPGTVQLQAAISSMTFEVEC